MEFILNKNGDSILRIIDVKNESVKIYRNGILIASGSYKEKYKTLDAYIQYLKALGFKEN